MNIQPDADIVKGKEALYSIGTITLASLKGLTAS